MSNFPNAISLSYDFFVSFVPFCSSLLLPRLFLPRFSDFIASLFQVETNRTQSRTRIEQKVTKGTKDKNLAEDDAARREECPISLTRFRYLTTSSFPSFPSVPAFCFQGFFSHGFLISLRVCSKSRPTERRAVQELNRR